MKLYNEVTNNIYIDVSIKEIKNPYLEEQTKERAWMRFHLNFEILSVGNVDTFLFSILDTRSMEDLLIKVEEIKVLGARVLDMEEGRRREEKKM